jgi:hypothetical protein
MPSRLIMHESTRRLLKRPGCLVPKSRTAVGSAGAIGYDDGTWLRRVRRGAVWAVLRRPMHVPSSNSPFFAVIAPIRTPSLTSHSSICIPKWLATPTRVATASTETGRTRSTIHDPPKYRLCSLLPPSLPRIRDCVLDGFSGVLISSRIIKAKGRVYVCLIRLTPPRGQAS